MKIETEDIIFGSLIVILLGIWYLTILIYNFPLMSIIILWIGMTIISLLYVYVYRKRKRDKKILKIRFYITAIPIYPMLAYYFYKLLVDHNLPKEQKLLPLFIIFFVLFFNAIIIYFYEIKKSN